MKCNGWDDPCNNNNAVRYRMNTNYLNEELNWNTLCPDCQKLCDDHWKEMWKEYYHDKL